MDLYQYIDKQKEVASRSTENTAPSDASGQIDRALDIMKRDAEAKKEPVPEPKPPTNPIIY
jgi:hypothetical protein